jgi:uncharacterized protein (DUF58 family)
MEARSAHRQRAEALRHRGQLAGAALPPLLVAADRIAVSVIQGVHGRRRAGPGEDFWQYRQYSFGDAANRIDWRKSARSERMLIRENEWAASNTLFVWASRAAGMSFRSPLSQVTKRDRATLLAVALAALAVRGGERVTALGSPHPPGHTRAALSNVAEWLEADAKRAHADLPQAVKLPRYATCVLVSDFFSPMPETTGLLTGFAAAGGRGHLLQVVDPAEETLPYHGRTEFLEFDGPERLIAGRAETLKEAYAQRLALHREALKDLVRKLGWSFTIHRTDRPPHGVLLSLYGLISGRKSDRRPRVVG